MFQYAVGRCLAKKIDTELCLDASWYHYPIKRRFEISRFNIEAPVVKSKLSFLSHMAFQTPGFGWRYSTVYRERPGRADLSVLSLPDGAFLIGHFPSEKYFKDVEDVIRRDFSFGHLPTSSQTADWLGEVESENSVAVHVRRGDYLTLPGFQVCSEDYYFRAIQYMRDHTANPRFYFFSDDPEWCKSLFQEKDCKVVEMEESRCNPLNDMRVVSACKHAIISNSTYSWWGVWLNGGMDRMVVAPDRWKNSDIDMEDTFLPSWTRIATVNAPTEGQSHG